MKTLYHRKGKGRGREGEGKGLYLIINNTSKHIYLRG